MLPFSVMIMNKTTVNECFGVFICKIVWQLWVVSYNIFSTVESAPLLHKWLRGLICICISFVHLYLFLMVKRCVFFPVNCKFSLVIWTSKNVKLKLWGGTACFYWGCLHKKGREVCMSKLSFVKIQTRQR